MTIYEIEWFVSKLWLFELRSVSANFPPILGEIRLSPKARQPLEFIVLPRILEENSVDNVRVSPHFAVQS